MKVEPIKSWEAHPWLLTKHYSRRLCPISHAFGAFRDGEMIGVVTFGIPSSSTLRAGVCGDALKGRVIELNRLCCASEKNLASALVGGALRLLPRPAIVVSFADCGVGHVGFVYQATNFLYTGLSAKRTDWKVRGLEHLHGATVADMSRGQHDRVAYMRARFGDDFYLAERTRKHRYVLFVGSKKEKKQMREALIYDVCPYPKGESQRYDASGDVATQGRLF